MNKFFFLITLLLVLSSCQGVKDALSGKKYESSDEFLVIKKKKKEIEGKWEGNEWIA